MALSCGDRDDTGERERESEKDLQMWTFISLVSIGLCSYVRGLPAFLVLLFLSTYNAICNACWRFLIVKWQVREAEFGMTKFERVLSSLYSGGNPLLQMLPLSYRRECSKDKLSKFLIHFVEGYLLDWPNSRPESWRWENISSTGYSKYFKSRK